jgi:hypothetical protein
MMVAFAPSLIILACALDNAEDQAVRPSLA